MGQQDGFSSFRIPSKAPLLVWEPLLVQRRAVWALLSERASLFQTAVNRARIAAPQYSYNLSLT